MGRKERLSYKAGLKEDLVKYKQGLEYWTRVSNKNYGDDKAILRAQTYREGVSTLCGIMKIEIVFLIGFLKGYKCKIFRFSP